MILNLIVLLFPFFIATPGIIGFGFARSIWFFFPSLFDVFGGSPAKVKAFVLLSGFVSILLVMGQYGWLMISAMTSPISEDGTQTYDNQVVLDAWRRSMIPPLFQKSCYSGEDLVCQLTTQSGLRLGMWDGEIYTDDLPWLAGLIAGLSSAMTVRSLFRFIPQLANTTVVDSIS